MLDHSLASDCVLEIMSLKCSICVPPQEQSYVYSLGSADLMDISNSIRSSLRLANHPSM